MDPKSKPAEAPQETAPSRANSGERSQRQTARRLAEASKREDSTSPTAAWATVTPVFDPSDNKSGVNTAGSDVMYCLNEPEAYGISQDNSTVDENQTSNAKGGHQMKGTLSQVSTSTVEVLRSAPPMEKNLLPERSQEEEDVVGDAVVRRPSAANTASDDAHALNEEAMVPTMKGEEPIEAHMVDEEEERNKILFAAEVEIRARIVAETVEVDAEPYEFPEPAPSLTKRRLGWLTLLALVVVGVVVAVLIVTGTTYNSESGPSVVDIASHNDICSSSVGPLPTDGSFTFNTTKSTTSFYDIGVCNGTVDTIQHGVWFHVNGTGLPLSASTCLRPSFGGFDTQIAVFAGGCAGLTCVGANNNGFDPECKSLGSLTWPSKHNEVYQIFVGGSEGNQGDFFLSVTETHEHDLCSTAAELRVDSPAVQGSTLGTTFDEVPVCNMMSNANNTVEKGVWYSVKGTGVPLLVSVCSERSSRNTDEAQVHLFGGSCDRLGCLEVANVVDDGCKQDWSSIVFPSAKGETYYLLVKGERREDIEFSLSIQETTPNDVCSTATTLSMETQFPVYGSTVDATFDGVTGCDGYQSGTKRGVWYEYTSGPTDSTVTASTCNKLNMTTPLIVIYRASDAVVERVPVSEPCGLLQCDKSVTMGTSCDRTQGTVSWISTAFQRSLLYIEVGSGQEGGHFQLHVTEEELPRDTSEEPTQPPFGDTEGLVPPSDDDEVDMDIEEDGAWPRYCIGINLVTVLLLLLVTIC